MISFPRRLAATVGAIITLAVVGAYMIRNSDRASAWLPLGLSIASLAVSVLSAFKNELFEFDPQLVGGAIILPQTEPRSNSLQFILPLNFVNAGYAEGVIEWVALKFVPTDGGEPFICDPVAEIDLVKYIQGRRHLHAENILGGFLPFPLESKKSLAKAILFSPQQTTERVREIVRAEYRMDVYLKAANRRPVKILTVEKALSAKLLEDFANGGSIMNMNRDIRL